jgi:hypothetical protein
MEIMLFNPSADKRCVPFVQQVKFWTTAGELEVYGSLKRLIAALNAHGNGEREKILVLLAATRDHLRDLCTAQDTLAEYRSILVLPDSREETLTMGRTLYPRFVMSLDEAPGELGAVLNRMMQSVTESARNLKPAPARNHPETKRRTRRTRKV